jgi:hypothetical protein
MHFYRVGTAKLRFEHQLARTVERSEPSASPKNKKTAA